MTQRFVGEHSTKIMVRKLGGTVALLALNGLFTLITKHGL